MMFKHINWFSFSPKFIKVFGMNFKLYNLFNTHAECGHYWGVGLMQFGQRHLFYIGNAGFKLFFTSKNHYRLN